MRSIHKEDLQGLPRFYRANLINCLSGPKVAVLVGTANAQGHTNLALFSNIFHLGADPALIGFVQRPVGQSGDTFRNIELSKSYTFNFVDSAMVERAHYTSARFDAGVSEFDRCGFTPQWVEGFNAPFVLECTVKVGLKLVEAIPVQMNHTILVLGSVEHIFLPEAILQEDGNLSLEAAQIVSVVGLEQYYTSSLLRKMPYARVEQLPEF